MTTPLAKLFLFLAIVLTLAGCANIDNKHTLYKMIDDSACIREIGYPNCHPDSMEYQQYKTEREAIKSDE